MAYDELVKAILEFVDWGITIIIILMVWEAWKLISVSGAKSAAGDITKGLTDWKRSPVLKLANRVKHKGKTRALNEAILEQQELQLIDSIAVNHNQLAATVKTVRTSLRLSNRDLTSIDQRVDDLQASVKTAVKRFRKLNRATTRQERVYLPHPALGLNTKNIEEVLRDKGIDPNVFIAEEKKLLERHKVARDALQKVRTIVDGQVSGARDKLVNLPVIVKATAWPIPFAKSASDIDKHLKQLEDALDDATLKAQIKVAENAQHEALKDMQGLVAASRKMWE